MSKTYNDLRAEFGNVYSDKLSSPIATIQTPFTDEAESISKLLPRQKIYLKRANLL